MWHYHYVEERLTYVLGGENANLEDKNAFLKKQRGENVPFLYVLLCGTVLHASS